MARLRPVVSAAVSALLCAVSSAQLLPGEVESFLELNAFSPGLAGQLSAGDRFGRAVATVRDLDDDGNGDIIVGAPWDDDGGPERGAVWILFLNADGTIRSTSKISSTSGAFEGVLVDGAHFGNAVAYLGDLDHDGTGDVAVSALGDDDGGTDTGAVWILFLMEDGTVERFQKISPLFGDFHLVLEAGDRFGRSVAGLPDIDGDGVFDLAVGANGDDDGAVDAGCVYVMHMTLAGTVKKATKISAAAGGFGATLQAADRFGQALAPLEDLDADGVPELFVGAWRDDTGAGDAGAVWLLRLDADGTVKSVLKIAHGLGGFEGPLDAGDRFGGSVAPLGDLDGDTFSDIAVGAYFDDDGGLSRGAVWILFLGPDGLVKGSQKISDTQGHFDGVLQNDDRFAAVGAIDDLDGDGTVDLGVGAMGDHALGTLTGAVWVLHLHASEWLDLGHALPGVKGAPKLQGLGTLLPETEVTVTISNAAPLANAMLVLGASPLEMPFFGGILVPSPDKLHGPDKTNALGIAVIEGRWPPDAPPGSSIWLQAWIPDATAPQGFSATNALTATSP